MRIRGMLVIIGIITLCVTGCQQEAIDVPKGAEEMHVVSHVNDHLLTFVHPDTNEKMEVDIGVTVADMARISPLEIVYTGKSSDALMELNLQTGKQRELAEVGSSINRVLFSEKNQALYLADSANHEVIIYDLKEGHVTNTVDVGEFPLAMTMNDQEDRLYVVNQQSSTVSVIDLNQKQLEKEFQVPNMPAGIGFDEGRLFVGGHGPVNDKLNRSVYVIDAQSGDQMKEIEVGLMPIQFYRSSETEDLYVICHGSHELYHINGETMGVAGSLKVGANPYDVTGDREHLYVSNLDSKTVAMIDLTSLTMTDEINVHEGPLKILVGGTKE